MTVSFDDLDLALEDLYGEIAARAFAAKEIHHLSNAHSRALCKLLVYNCI